MIKLVHKILWLNTQHQWGVIMITIHWLSAVTIFGMFGLGLWMVELGYYEAWYHKAPDLHKSIGITLLVLTFVRLFWRQFNRRPFPLKTHNHVKQILAISMHNILYLLLISLMLSGYLISTADGRSIVVFNVIQMPALIQGIEYQEDVAGVVHFWLAISLICMAVLHVLATLKHHFIDCDRTLKRMFGF